jgi:formylglycine-generating enzyme required for sulfatase activity/outer membrane protein OmpA-like peptidoglycan-associated protein
MEVCMKKLIAVVSALAAVFGSFAQPNEQTIGDIPLVHFGPSPEPNEQIIGDILFVKDSSDFANSDFADLQLEEWAGVLKQLKVKQIRVTGYANKTGEPPEEEGLAKERAEKVITALKGLLPDMVFAEPAAKIFEWDSAVSEDKRSLNRRAAVSVEIDPPQPGLSPESLAVLAEAYYELGNLKLREAQNSTGRNIAKDREAKELFDKAIKLESGFIIPPLAGKVQACIYLGEWKQAFEIVKALEKHDPVKAKESLNIIAKAKGFVLIQGGTFTMGSDDARRDAGKHDEPPYDEIPHKVTVSSFYINKYEVTQEEYEQVMGQADNHSMNTYSKRLPVENVSWFDAVEYCNKLSIQEGLTPAYTVNGQDVTWNREANGYRLPAEAEWEFACRANTITPFNTGTNITTEQANYNGLKPYTGNATGVYRGYPMLADAAFTPNKNGLVNMHGNVWEWCWDWYGPYSTDDQTNPEGPKSPPLSGKFRVRRGGSYGSPGYEIRSASRGWDNPSGREPGVGFRLALPIAF